MGEKFLDQSGLVVLRNWVLFQIQNGSSGGGFEGYAKVLWENPSPTSAFNPQDITIEDLYETYPAVVIEYEPYCDDKTALATMFTNPIPVGHGGVMYSVAVSSANYGGRYFSVMADRVRFLWGHNHAAGHDQKISVPVAIYGVNSVTTFQRPEPELGKSYLIAPRSYEGTIANLRGIMNVRTPSNGMAYLFTGWMTTRCGTGLTVVTPWSSGSYGFAYAGPFDVTGEDVLTVKGKAMCYNGTDYIGIFQTEPSANLSTNATGWSNQLDSKQDIVSSANTLTPFNMSFDVSSMTGNCYLAIMCAGSASDTGYPGIVCIEEAYLGTNEAQASDL